MLVTTAYLVPEDDDEREDDDVRLVAAVQRNRAAFAPLYQQYARPIYRYCYRRLGSHEAAEDATSQTFVKALDGIGRFQGSKGTFRSWLYTIADRVVTDLYRRQRPNVVIEAAFDIASPEPGPDERAVRSEITLNLQQSLLLLTPDQQRVVALRLAGLTGPEIAVVTGREHQAVKSLQFRAFARLRRLLADREEGAL
jgi:RNA polymerase sigma factor (sigma-70 family)